MRQIEPPKKASQVKPVNIVQCFMQTRLFRLNVNVGNNLSNFLLKMC